MTEIIEVHTTIDSKEAAQKIAEAIISKRLAACVQVSGPIISTYWWEGKIERTEEWVCTAKSRKELYSDLEQAIRENHSYNTPEILAVEVVAGNRSYLDWIEQETGRGNLGVIRQIAPRLPLNYPIKRLSCGARHGRLAIEVTCKSDR